MAPPSNTARRGGHRTATSPRAYLLWGQEELRKREALQSLLDELVSVEDRELDVETVDATNAGVSGESILHAARDRAMFSERRVVVVVNAQRLRAPRHQRTQEVLAEGLAALPESATVIFVAGAEDADERRGRLPFGEKLIGALRSCGAVRQFAALKPPEMAQVAIREAAAVEKKMAPGVAAALAARVGTDSQRLVQEVHKLAAYVGERPAITVEDVAAMVPPPPDDNVFHLLDAAMAGNRPRALSVLRELRESGVAVPQLLILLGRTLRQVAQAKYLQEHRVSPSAAADAVPAELLQALPEEGGLYGGGSQGWQRQRLWDQARRLSWEHLHHALDRLAVTDAGTKGWDHGVEDPDLALELFVVSLCGGLQ